ALAPHVPEMPRGLRAMLFTAEEWGLYGSRVYVNELPEEERRRIAVNVNLDTIAGSPRLACLTSGFEELETLARSVEKQLGIGLDIVRDLRRNSDHYNFARHGIPALRLVCGFDAVDSAVKYLLMPADTRDKVHEGEFKFGAAVAAEFVWHALVRNGSVARHKTAEETKRLLQGLE
ncbi:MAG: M28 family peptidase, partial [Alphaproteobacteria bacterium]|nr:M28 family peptidase [Alphaproteobacteria bacterium]